MAISLSAPNIEPNMSHGSVGVKVAQMAKDQQEVQGEIALSLINAAAPEVAKAPVGNIGHNINTTA
ncbi:cytoplasmic protein [uncultured Shewanella sp.]|uniref:cytoplasmic protein n=1 Tax=uncultured Shewanella sp. TaxID=173975 RepID=UPI002624453C|nr:cytoplasmic protein [uncultured Shewanella sp.]